MSIANIPILIVEDSAIQAEVLRRTLVAQGFSVTVAKDGAEGLELARQQKPRLVISDIKMPVMDGYELCSKIKQEEDLKGIPVILLTELSDIKDIVRGVESGADYYVTKPYDEKYLLARVGTLLEKPGQEIIRETKAGMEVTVAGERHTITADAGRIWRLLVSTYENAIEQNKRLLEMQQALKNNLQFLQTLMNAIPYPIFYNDISGVFLGCNKAFEEFHGRTRDQIIGITVSELHVKGADVHMEMDKALLEQADIRSYELSETDASGNPHDFMIIKASFQNAEGRVAGIIGAMIDITDRKHYELQLQEANATKDKFFSIIAHDLKNPFAVILGFSELLRNNAEKLSADKMKDMSDNIYKSSKTAYELLENLLQWSRSQTGRLEFNPQPIKLSDQLAESITIVENQAHNKKIEVVNEVKDFCVQADANLLNTVLRNLLGNAIKYTNSGGKVTVASRELPKLAEIWVQDTGVGIPPEDMNKIFRIDVKYSTRGTADEPGTGLGLILCKEFIEKHGGKIWVESELGKGTTIKFTLPRC